MMKLLKIATIVLIALFSIEAAAQQWESVNSIGGLSNRKYAFDKLGNTYVAGEFILRRYIAPDYKYSVVSRGGTDIALVKLDTLQNLVWVKTFGNNQDDHVGEIQVDDSGNVVLIGYFLDSIYFDTNTLHSQGMYDGYVAFIDDSGNEEWVKGFGTKLWECTTFGTPLPKIALNRETQKILITVETPTWLESIEQEDDTFSIYYDTSVFYGVGESTSIMVLNYKGELSKVATNESWNMEMLLINNEQIEVWSSYSLTLDGVKYRSPQGGSSSNHFVVKRTNDSINWVKSISFFGSDVNWVDDGYVDAIKRDSLGNLYFGGTMACYRAVCGNKQASGPNKDGGGYDFFIGKLDSTGECKWLYAGGSYGSDYFKDLTIRNNNSIFITGGVSGGGFYRGDTFVGVNGQNTLVMEVDSNGKLIYAELQGGNGGNIGEAATCLPNGKMLFAGITIRDTLTFGNIKYYEDMWENGGIYFAIRNFEPLPADTSTVSIKEKERLSVHAYPNPTNGIITLRDYEDLYKTQITLTDALGREVPVKILSHNQLDLSALENGFYVLTIQFKDVIGSISIIKN